MPYVSGKFGLNNFGGLNLFEAILKPNIEHNIEPYIEPNIEPKH